MSENNKIAKILKKAYNCPNCRWKKEECDINLSEEQKRCYEESLSMGW